MIYAVYHPGRHVTIINQAQRYAGVCIFLFLKLEENTADNDLRVFKQLIAFA